MSMRNPDIGRATILDWSRSLPRGACVLDVGCGHGRQFDAVVSVGLMFLLPADVQRTLIGKVSQALKPRGRFVFTAPDEAVRWQDSLTGAESISLGTQAYRDILREAGLSPTGQTTDEGMNDYHFGLKQ